MLDSDDESLINQMIMIGKFDQTKYDRFKSFKNSYHGLSKLPTPTYQPRTSKRSEIRNLAKDVNQRQNYVKISDLVKNRGLHSFDGDHKATETSNQSKSWSQFKPSSNEQQHASTSGNDNKNHQEEILTHLKFLCFETVRHNRAMEEKLDGVRNLLSILVQSLHINWAA